MSEVELPYGAPECLPMYQINTSYKILVGLIKGHSGRKREGAWPVWRIKKKRRALFLWTDFMPRKKAGEIRIGIYKQIY